MLNLFEPTRERVFTYYDRAPIAFDSVEMRAIRVRVKLEILATPLYRTQNLRYPYFKEFYGYGQTFFNNIHVDDIAINYPVSYIYDYWNQHGLLAQQFAIFLENSTEGIALSHQILGNLAFPESTDLASAIAQTLSLTRDQGVGFISDVPGGLNLSDGSTSYVQTFNSPINLLRFKFTEGTIFKVTIQSWTLPITEGGSSVGNPVVAEPYDTDNPNESAPTPSGDRAPNGEPYGANPPPQSPFDPSLDPDDYSNPPAPPPPPGTAVVQGWKFPAVPGQQSLSYAVGCPGATPNASLGDNVNYINPENLGTANVRINAQGLVSTEDVQAAFPGFVFGANFFGADGRCGIGGAIAFGN